MFNMILLNKQILCVCVCVHAREKVWKDDNDGFLWEGADNRHNGRLSLFNLYIPRS